MSSYEADLLYSFIASSMGWSYLMNMHDKWWTILIFSSQKYVNLNFIINQMEATRLSSVIWYSVADTTICPTRKWQPCRLRALLDNLYHLYDSNKTTTAKDNSG
jgi:hypothetical protein